MSRRKNPITVRLPRSYAGKRITKHPILIALEGGRKRSDIARAVGVGRHSILSAEYLAKANRDFLVPATWVRAYSEITGLPPYVFRPDLFIEGWTYPKRGDGND